MQWGQIKTLFIISFLILDLFLLQQFLTKQEKAEDVGTIQDSTLVESYRDEDITIADDVPDETPEVASLTASPGKFSDARLEQIRKINDQDIRVYGGELLVSTLDDPVSVDVDNVSEVVSDHVPFSSQYSYWGWNQDRDKILFFQTSNSNTIYYNSAGVLIIDVANGEMTGYKATILEPGESEENIEEELLSPTDVIQILFGDGMITSGDEVTSMTMGYHSAANLDPLQVFAPTWKVTVNGQEDHFVNALAVEGQILSIEEERFIRDTMQSFQEIIDENEQDVFSNQETDTDNDDDDQPGMSD
ncbi:two-component system regulatory protein YycI [Halobacillus sp. Marseille-Q1614]|uniref:two-component system regulatory protein YycI n=1 Tax=Halobacillus sp. Marseille-Q1614 TaxID=2709134 RepID=UPI00157057C1|nr:two-component system regulatory protein YycI [Halobacillus sp. Marseille-Q1614]